MILAFTGIRDIKLTLDLANRLHDNVENYIIRGCNTFLCGGAITVYYNNQFNLFAYLKHISYLCTIN